MAAAAHSRRSEVSGAATAQYDGCAQRCKRQAEDSSEKDGMFNCAIASAE